MHRFLSAALICALFVCFSSFAVAQSYDVYVSDAGGFRQPPWQILRYDADGGNGEVFIDDELAWPQDIVFLEEEGVVLISNLVSNRINRHDAETGEFIDIFADNLAEPTRMQFGPDGLLYVLQWTGSGLVRRYQRDGTFVDDFTSAGVDRAIGMAWDAAGNLYVSSFQDATVRRFDTNGADQGLFIESGLVGPTTLFFQDNGNLLITDYNAGRVREFDSDGVLLRSFGIGLSQPEGIAQLPNGNFLIGNGGNGAITEFEPDGTLVGDLVTGGVGGLVQPNAVVLRSKGDAFQINAGLNDAWYEPATSGQGMLVTVFPEREEMFVAWFTFEAEATSGDATVGAADQRWLTAQGSYAGGTADLVLKSATGGVFDSPDADVTNGDVGTLRLQFESCTSATATYAITDGDLSGEIPLQRIAADNVALCETLEAQ